LIDAGFLTFGPFPGRRPAGKRIGEGDTGPNTGGMGAYSPAPILDDAVLAKAMDRIVKPTVAEMARRGTPYTGVLYAGLMIADGEPRLVEYNVRFGDPECQVLMMRLGAQALDLMLACAEGRLSEMTVNWAPDHAMTVVLAAKGYPGAYTKGTQIRGLDALPEDAFHMMFHAGTGTGTVRIIATGGRVLNATGRGATLQEARDRAYALAEAVDWPEGVYRRDIGGLSRLLGGRLAATGRGAPRHAGFHRRGRSGRLVRQLRGGLLGCALAGAVARARGHCGGARRLWFRRHLPGLGGGP
jgi:phosphoribosylamine--glycine ligase